jgi:hypothetical protein
MFLSFHFILFDSISPRKQIFKYTSPPLSHPRCHVRILLFSLIKKGESGPHPPKKEFSKKKKKMQLP